MQKYWSVLFAVVLLLCFGLTAAAPVMGWWLPLNVASFGDQVDLLFYVILIVTTFFFILTEALLVYAMWKFAAEPGRKAAFVHGNHTLEMMWTAVPGILLIVLGVVQINAWADIKYTTRMPKPNGQTQQMEVTARQWEWRVRYPSPARMAEWEKDPKKAETFDTVPHIDDIHAVNEVHVWSHQKSDTEKQRVLIHLKTRDVIHSFFLPNLRLKQDALPGKSIPVWFMSEDYNTKKNDKGQWQDGYDPKSDTWNEYNEKKGTWTHPDRVWDLACAEFCGARHSMMKGKLFVHKDKTDFLEWLTAAEKAQNARQVESK